MIKLSPYTPIVFPGHAEGITDDGYLQVFATTDRILVEAFGAEGSAVCLRSGDYEQTVQFTPVEVNPEVTLHYAEITGLAEGVYVMEIAGYGESLPFIVTEDKTMLEWTVLMQYSMPDNRQTDKGLFIIAGEQRFFDLRVKGGFKDSQCEFGVDNEQYETPGRDIVELSSVDFATLTLTVGGSEGCPAHIGEMLNTALTCRDIYVNGSRYEYASNDIVITQPHPDTDRYVYSVRMRKGANADPAEELGVKELILRSAGEELRQSGTGTPRLIKRQ